MISKSIYICTSRWPYPWLMIIFFMTLSLSFSHLCIAQDSLQVDSSVQNFPVNIQDSLVENLALSTTEDKVVEKKKARKKRKESLTKKQQNIIGQNSNSDHHNFSKHIKSIFLWVFISVIILFITIRTILAKIYHTSISEAVKHLSRQDYYRNVYLKSEAWQRKRFVVLKRDNWKCVYCGQKATQVHHTRYARINIGNEPIEWLVSICKSCHESLH